MMMSTSDLLIMIGCALAAGVGMTMIGVLIEFSLRKQVLPAQRPAAQPPAAEPQPAPPSPPPQPEAAAVVMAEAPQPASAQPAAEPPAVPMPEAAPLAAAPVPPPEAVAPAPLLPVAEARPEPEEEQPPAAAAPPLAAPAPRSRTRATHPGRGGPGARPAAVSRFRLGLRKTRDNFMGRLRAVIGGGAKAEEIYEGLEEALIGADVGRRREHQAGRGGAQEAQD